VSGSGEYSCTDCGASRPDGQATPCTECGSTAVTQHIFVSDSATGSESWSIAGTNVSTARPWREMWIRTLDGLEAIRRGYAGSAGQMPINEWVSVVTDFFVAAHHLHDWIRGDPAVSAIVKDAALTLFQSDVSIGLAVDFSNTYKHHTRKSAGRHVQIGAFYCSANRCTAEIAWTDNGSRQARSLDALTLAENCITAWRSFLTAQGLLP
jgi:hypothetical protein